MSQSTPLISIGIPTYNRPVTLRRALSSVVNQTYGNLEIIVSDNGSTNPEVQHVINEFSGDQRVRFVRQPKNLGLVGNFNYLATVATGTYFMWLADDDWLDANYVEECSSFLQANPDYSAAYGAGKIFDMNQQFMNSDVPISMEQPTYAGRLHHFLQEVISNGCFSALFPLKLRDSLEMKDIIAGDWLIVLRFAFRGKYRMLTSTSVNISFGGASSTTEGLTRHMSTFTRSFPYLAVAFNVANDIFFHSQVYKDLNLFSRLKLARSCFRVVYYRFYVRNEIRPGVRKFLSLKKQSLKSVFKRSQENAAYF